MSRKLGILKLVLATGVFSAVVQVASAHATFVGSEPTDGAALVISPTELVLHFSETVSPISIQLINERGQIVSDLAPPVVDLAAVRIALNHSLAPGQYILSCRVISDDAHPVATSFAFSVAQSAQRRTGNAVAATVDIWRIPVFIGSALFLLSSLLAAGAALFLALLNPIGKPCTTAQQLSRTAATAAVVLGVAYLGLAGAQIVGGDFSSVYSSRAWIVAAGSTLGRSLLITLLGTAAIIWGAPRHGTAKGMRGARMALLLGAIGIAAGRALTGHAAATRPVAFMIAAMTTHFLAASFWIGSLWPLLRSLGTGSTCDTAGLLVRFSRIAVWSVAALVVVGLAMAAIHLGEVDALTGSTYGRLLIWKIAVVSGILLLAVVNKLIFTPALERQRANAIRSLQSSIVAEISGLLVVVGISAALASTAPPAEQLAVHFSTSQLRTSPTACEGDVCLQWIHHDTAAREGGQLAFVITTKRGRSLDPLEARVELSFPARGIAPMAIPVSRVGAGLYRIATSRLQISGAWHASVAILVGEFDEVSFEAEVFVPENRGLQDNPL